PPLPSTPRPPLPHCVASLRGWLPAGRGFAPHGRGHVWPIAPTSDTIRSSLPCLSRSLPRPLRYHLSPPASPTATPAQTGTPPSFAPTRVVSFGGRPKKVDCSLVALRAGAVLTSPAVPDHLRHVATLAGGPSGSLISRGPPGRLGAGPSSSTAP